ncbi:MAG: PEP-CTERM sorting domain-containing protein [Planctomycetaceae bacterium]
MKREPPHKNGLAHAAWYRRRLFIGVCLSGFLLAASPAFAAPIVLSNATTELTVFGGEADNGAADYGGYFQYVDLATGEETTWSIDPIIKFVDGSTVNLANGLFDGFGSPEDLGGGIVGSVALDTVTVVAYTELIGTIARTTFDFVAAPGFSLEGLSFIFAAENDLFGFADDAAMFTGSIAGGDLNLFQFDSAAGGLTVRLSGEAVKGSTLDLFGSGLYSGFGTSLEAGDLTVLSADGSNFVTSGDLGLALAFSLNDDGPCNCAQIVIDYDTQLEPPDDAPPIPEPGTMVLLGTGCLGLFLHRRYRKKS